MKTRILLCLSILIFTKNLESQYVNEWLLNINEPSSYAVHSFNLLKDANNNLLLIGYTTTQYYGSAVGVVIQKYNTSGILQWSNVITKIGLDSFLSPVYSSLDNQGNIYIAGLNYGDTVKYGIFLVKYNNAGVFQNSTVYKHNPLWNTIPAACIMDNNGNIYVTGRLHRFTTNHEDSLLTVKFNSGLQKVWSTTFYPAALMYELYGNDIIIDSSTNCYITGRYQDYTNQNVITQKYNSNGTIAWTAYFHNPQAIKNECGNSIRLDNTNNIYVGGISGAYPPGDSIRSCLLKYNNGGVLQFARTNAYHYNISSFQQKNTIILDGLGSIYVCVKDIMYPNSFISKYSVNGQLLWKNQFSNIFYNNAYNSYDGSLITCGYKNYNNKQYLNLTNISGNGILTWEYNFQNYFSTFDVAASLITGTGNPMYISGTSKDSLMILAKLIPAETNSQTVVKNNLNKLIQDSSLTYDTINFNLPTSFQIQDVNITIDSIIHPNAGDLEISLIHNGITDTLAFRRGTPLANFIGTHLDDTCTQSICTNGLPPFTGYFKPCQPLGLFNYTYSAGSWILRIYDRRAPNTGTLKAWSLNITFNYPIGINPIPFETPKTFSLSQNYPNPFNPATKIRFSIPPVGDAYMRPVHVIVYDILGREVATLVNEQLKPGTYEVTWPAPTGDAAKYPSGVYFYKLEVIDASASHSTMYTESKKMILLK